MSKDNQTKAAPAPRTGPKPRYRIINWPDYNQALCRRGQLSLWLPTNLGPFWYQDSPGPRIGGYRYSQRAIEFCLTLRQAYHLPYRQTQGFIEDLFEWLGLEVSVPSYSQLQRRGRDLNVDLHPAEVPACGPVDVVIDSTGLKVSGQGEWKVRQHGKGKNRQWLKLTLVSQPQGLEILAQRLTHNDIDDAQSGLEVMARLGQPVRCCAADGAYDKEKFRACLSPATRQLIPPQENAVASAGNPVLAQRDEAIAEIATTDRATWKRAVGYHMRSKAEVNMFRYKTVFGERIRGRKLVNQATEVALNCKLLNRFAQLGLPQSRLIRP